jgi:hypothetical protein
MSTDTVTVVNRGKIMRKLVGIAAAGAAVIAATVSSTASHAAVGQSMATAIDTIAPVEKVGCYRLGETGYHWYRFCFGPSFLYPHQRVCRHGYCWYR